VLHVFGALAEFERSLMYERTMAGLIAARAHGRRGRASPRTDCTSACSRREDGRRRNTGAGNRRDSRRGSIHLYRGHSCQRFTEIDPLRVSKVDPSDPSGHFVRVLERANNSVAARVVFMGGAPLVVGGWPWVGSGSAAGRPRPGESQLMKRGDPFGLMPAVGEPRPVRGGSRETRGAPASASGGCHDWITGGGEG
jgi:hypothetical protein